MNQENRIRLGAYARSIGVDALLLTNPATITWLTGYAPPIQTGPSPFEGGPAIGWWRDDEVTLVVSDAEAGALEGTGVDVRPYVGYSIDEPLTCSARQRAALGDLLREHQSLRGAIGVEFDTAPAFVVQTLSDTLQATTHRHLDEGIAALRAVKTDDEIARIRAALRLCDTAQNYLRDTIRPGVTEIALWIALKGHLEVTAAARLPILADLVAGRRTADIGGLPGDNVLEPGDAVILDIVPRLDGYWGDNAGTYFVDGPPPQLAEAYKIVLDTLYRGIDAVRPGVRAQELDTLLRQSLQSAGYVPYPHHSGHGLGTTYHEEPRLVPYNSVALEAGMVVAIEPGIYLPDIGGVRLEHVVLVTADGCEVLTHHLDRSR